MPDLAAHDLDAILDGHAALRLACLVAVESGPHVLLDQLDSDAFEAMRVGAVLRDALERSIRTTRRPA